MVQFTADQEMHDKLAQAQELMRNVVPRGDFVAVFDRALDLLIADRKKTLFGLRTSSRSSRVSGAVAPAGSDRANDAAKAPATPVAVSVDSVVSDPPHKAELDEASAELTHPDNTTRTLELSAEPTHPHSTTRTPEISAEPTHPDSTTRTLEISAEPTHPDSTTRTRELSAEPTHRDSTTRTQEVSANRMHPDSTTRTRELGAECMHEGSAVGLPSASTERIRERSAPDQPESQSSTYIPRAVRRDVMARDGYQCTFVGPEGNRCPELGRLHLDHFPVPSSCDGPATSDNLRVRCAAHNALAAEKFFGRDWVLQKIAGARAAVTVSQNEAVRRPNCATGSQNEAIRGLDRVTGSQHESVRDPDRVTGSQHESVRGPDTMRSTAATVRERTSRL